MTVERNDFVNEGGPKFIANYDSSTSKLLVRNSADNNRGAYIRVGGSCTFVYNEDLEALIGALQSIYDNPQLHPFSDTSE